MSLLQKSKIQWVNIPVSNGWKVRLEMVPKEQISIVLFFKFINTAIISDVNCLKEHTNLALPLRIKDSIKCLTFLFVRSTTHFNWKIECNLTID